MPHPKGGYTRKDGSKVAGTTTVIGRFKDSGPLLFWAFNQGKSGAASLYEQRDKAGEIGTVVHDAAEQRIQGLDLRTIRKLMREALLIPEDLQKATSGFDAFLAWEKMSRLVVTHTEIGLVDPDLGYGGTLDGLGVLGKPKGDGLVDLIDFKTSNGVYVDYLLQLAAYKNLVENGYVADEKGRATDEKLGLKIAGFHLIRFAKEHGDFAHHYYTDLGPAFEQFTLFLRAYEIDKILKKRV